MTNAQKWVTAFLVLFILLLVLSKMTDRQENSNEISMTDNYGSVENQSSEVSVESLFANNKCYNCHGKDLNGTMMGPSLANVSNNWEKESLVSYFKDPKSFLNSPRMSVLKNKFNREMPSQEKMTTEELEAIAEFLLGRK